MSKPVFITILCLVFLLPGTQCIGQEVQKETNAYGLSMHPSFKWPPKTYVCYKASGPLAIDGVLNESSWKDAAWSESFRDIMGSHFPQPRYATKMKMLWDEDYLYVAAHLEEPHLWATITQRDEVIFYDNDFEVFIDPDGDTYGYFELEINALNTVWDLMLIRPYRNGGPAIDNWDINGLKTAVHLDGTLNDPSDTDEGWYVEIAIPLEAINEYNRGPKPADGVHWRINFSRVQWRYSPVEGQYKKDVNPETGKSFPEDNWVWSPQGVVDMHRPELWGILQFSDKKPGTGDEAFVPNPDDLVKWEIRNVYYAQKIYFEQNNRYTTRLNELQTIGLLTEALRFAPVIQTTFSGFQVKATNPKTGHTWLIDEGGRVMTK